MSDACDKSCEVEALRERHSAVLKWVLVINAVMFVVMVAAALYARSSALLSDSLDNLGDALTYALSLYAVGLATQAKARVALFKGVLILLAAIAVLTQIAYRLVYPAVPIFETMGIFSLVALAANSLCFGLLWKYRTDDVNMSSVWECSRNDIAANLSVFVAAAGVWATGSGWPDIVVACGLTLLFLRSAFRVTRSAMLELRQIH